MKTLTPPFSVLEHEASFEVRDARGMGALDAYFEDEPDRTTRTLRMVREATPAVREHRCALPEPAGLARDGGGLSKRGRRLEELQERNTTKLASCSGLPAVATDQGAAIAVQ